MQWQQHASRSRFVPALLAAGLFALALALYGATIVITGFDGLIGQDPFGYYGYALQVHDSLRAFQEPPPYYWPLGYPLLVAAGFALLGQTPLAGQLASTLCGAGVVALTGLLAHDLWQQQLAPQSRRAADEETHTSDSARRVALVAGFIALGCGQLWQWSVVVMADTAALCWATLAAWALVRYAAYQRLAWLLLASGALAAAICSRWVYGLLALPLGAYWLLTIWPSATTAHKSRVISANAFGIYSRSFAQISGHAALAALLGLLLLAPQLLLSARFEHPPLAHQWLVAWSPLNAGRRVFDTPDGTARYALPVALFYARAAASPRFLFPLLAPLVALGALVMLRRRWWGAALLLGGWLAAMYGFLCGVPYQNGRFVLALLPPLAILAAIGFDAGWGWLRPRWRLALLGGLCACLLGGLWYSGGTIREYVAKKDADIAVTRWVERETRPGDRLLAFELTLTLRHYTALDVRELFDQTPASLQTLAAAERPLFLLVDTADLQSQWLGYAPERNASWLRDHVGLAALGELNGYTLFRVHTTRATIGH